ncbi:MAG TPA: HutD family protein [Dyella sp.]|uniref:HutD family protein n=1 Tax=Dyella sp. TaxID=1869338 RepID=UPI002D7A3301|nr:HutD family protein [Dyella sp.]HET6553194.1 HutD family protein [Dyella sp.]
MSQLRPLATEKLSAKPCSDGSVLITDIACSPDSDDWQWRMSMIGIGEHDLEFPAHADIHRHFVPLDAPVDVVFPDGRTQHLNRFDVAHFDSHNDPECCLPESPTRTFNLKLREGIQGELMARPLNGTMVLLAPAGWRWFVLLLSGEAKVIADHRSHVMTHDDMMWIDPIPGHPVRIEGGGEIVLARLPAA